MTRRLACALALIGVAQLTAPAGSAAQDPAPTEVQAWDPTTIDPMPVDLANPPRLVPVWIESGGSRIDGLVYLADGPGPHATVVFVPDVPGHESNVDFAQAVRRAGYNALVFRYRGTWGSGGEFSWSNAAEDVGAVLDFLGSAEAADGFRVDPERVHLVADGFGGWAALTAVASRPGQGCIATTGAWNPAVRARELGTGGAAADAWRRLLAESAGADRGPIRANPAELLAALTESPERFDLVRSASGARDRAVLMITSSEERDPARQTMLVGAAMAGAGAASVERFIINDDEAFSSSRVRVARSLVTWLERSCPAW